MKYFEAIGFINPGYGGLAGAHPREFSKEVQAAHRRSLERAYV